MIFLPLYISFPEALVCRVVLIHLSLSTAQCLLTHLTHYEAGGAKMSTFFYPTKIEAGVSSADNLILSWNVLPWIAWGVFFLG